MPTSRDCKILRPVLVAIVYGESHPERARLLTHVRKCAHCRAELEELREVKGWISDSNGLDSTDSAFSPSNHAPSRRSAVVPRAATAAVGLLVVTLIFSGSPGRREARVAEVASSGASASVALRSVARPARPSGVFGVDGIDQGIDSVRAQIVALGRDGW